MAMPYDRVLRGPRPNLGASAQNYYQSGFFIKIWLFLINYAYYLADFLHFWGILGIFGGQILGGSWG
jgi:hypothetical protein